MTRRIVLKKLRIENFKGFKEAEFNFFDHTKVSGVNGAGKSSIAAAYMWLLFDIGYNLVSNPPIRRKIRRDPVNDVPVSVEATLEIDGTVVAAKKVQKRSFKKDGSFTDGNTYFINDVPKTLRDFNAYFDLDMNIFELCSNPNAFLAQKPAEMREFLFNLIEDVSDLDVAQQFEELSDLAPLLEKYTADELSAMNKASIKKIKTQQDGIPAAIAENRRYLVDDADTAEMELQKNALEEQLQEVRKQRDDSREAYKAVADLQAEIMKTKLDIGGMEQAAAMRLEKQRREARQLHGELQAQAYDLMQTRQGKESELERQKALKESKQEKLDGLVEEWKKARALTMDESETICKFCGQELPADRLEEVRANFEKRKAELVEKTLLDGRRVRAEFDSTKEKIATLETEIADLKQQWNEASGKTNKAYEALNAVPASADLSEDQEYLALQEKLRNLEQQLSGMDTGEALKQQLAAKEKRIQGELDSVKAKLLSVMKNAEYEERIADLEASRRTLEQDKADCERILNQLDQLDEKKNTLLVDKINSHFQYVKWDLFSRGKNGAYLKNYCKPVIDDRDYGDDTNTGREILARLDIAMAAQRATGIYCPIFLDFGESIDSWRIPKGESQLIVLCRTDDAELKIEEVRS